MKRTITCFVIQIALASLSCGTISTVSSTPTVVATATPERPRLINGEITACLLISSVEVEAISNIKVTSESGLKSDLTYCRYISAGGDVILLTSVTTDATLKKANKSYSAAEWYEMQKKVSLDMSKILKVEDIDNFGDQAYSREGSTLEINVLKNDIIYLFSTRTLDSGGIGYEALMKLAEIALQRMP